MGIDGSWSKFLKINALLLRHTSSTLIGRIIEFRLTQVRINQGSTARQYGL